MELRILGLQYERCARISVVEPACSQVGRAIQTTATILAALCFFFGIAFAAFVPVSLEERISFFCFAFVLALGFCMSGYILRQMLGLSCKVCEIMGARCARLLAPLANEILGRRVQNLENRLVEQSRLLNESKLELKHLCGEIEIARKAEADLRSALNEIDDRANAAIQNLEAEKAKLQAALDRANGERVRLAYDLANMKRQADSMAAAGGASLRTSARTDVL